MKNLNFLMPILVITMILTSCNKEEIYEESLENDLNLELIKTRGHDRPFHATVIGTGVPPSPDVDFCGSGFPILHVELTLTGNATHMGKVTGSIESCVNISTSPPSFTYGLTTLVAANGDELHILGFEDPYIISGGTGRFDDATGTLTSSFIILSPGVFENYFDGTIQY